MLYQIQILLECVENNPVVRMDQGKLFESIAFLPGTGYDRGRGGRGYSRGRGRIGGRTRGGGGGGRNQA